MRHNFPLVKTSATVFFVKLDHLIFRYFVQFEEFLTPHYRDNLEGSINLIAAEMSTAGTTLKDAEGSSLCQLVAKYC